MFTGSASIFGKPAIKFGRLPYFGLPDDSPDDSSLGAGEERAIEGGRQVGGSGRNGNK